MRIGFAKAPGRWAHSTTAVRRTMCRRGCPPPRIVIGSSSSRGSPRNCCTNKNHPAMRNFSPQPFDRNKERRLDINRPIQVADHAIAEVRRGLDYALAKDGIAPEVLMLVARAFARAELDPGRALQEAMMSAVEAQSASMPAALRPQDIADHFAELAAALDNDPFAIYAELATTAAAFPAEHHAAMAGALKIAFEHWLTPENFDAEGRQLTRLSELTAAARRS